MADPKGTYFSETNQGFGTPITGLWKPAFAVAERQRQEGELKKKEAAAAKQKAIDDNLKFGEDLFKEKFNSLDTQRNEYKNQLLTQLRENYNQANLRYSSEGKSIPLTERQELERQLQGFKSEWEQIETAYNYTQGVLKHAEADKTGKYNLDNLKEVIVDVPTNEDGKIDFSKYNEKYVEQQLKANALKVYNAPKVAENFMKTVAQTKLARVHSLGNGQHDEKTEAAKGLKVFKDKYGRDIFENPETGLPELDDSTEALALARQDEDMNALIEAKVAQGEAETPAEAYRQLIANQAKVEKTINRQGSIRDAKDGDGSGKLKPNQEATFDLLRDFVGFKRPVNPTSITALQNTEVFRSINYRNGVNVYKPGTKEFNDAVQNLKLPFGERIYPGERNPFENIEVEVLSGKDEDKNNKYEKLTFSIRNEDDKDRTMRVLNNYLSKLEEYKEGTMTQGELNKEIKALKNLELYDMNENSDTVNPEGESLY